ncbi:hypothetical protein DPV78_004598 [Talaromyces pinophilus]|nr:hypothetical protein DPV78_004598 [Talaromyces pinophilus]
MSAYRETEHWPIPTVVPNGLGRIRAPRTPTERANTIVKGLSVGTLMDHGRNFTALVRKNMQDQKSLGKIETNDCDERRGIV